MTASIFKTWNTSRNLYAAYFDNYSLEQLNKIPAGFNNNLIWNIGHIIVAQQSLIYQLSNLQCKYQRIYSTSLNPAQNQPKI